MKQFIEKCLVSVSQRLSARELLNDPFLRAEEFSLIPIVRQPSFSRVKTNNGHRCVSVSAIDNDVKTHCFDLFNSHENESFGNVDITINGKMEEDGGIFLRLRIADNEGKRYTELRLLL